MSSNDPLELIDQYLDRVRIYLPLDSEDAIVELQTHLIEEAERIGGGKMTAGSAMMAIERMGDPKNVANEYAGSGKRVGPVPAEYVSPLSRMLIVIVGVALALIVGFTMVGGSLSELFGASIQNWPFQIPIMIGINLAIIIVILGGISLLDRRKPLTDKTMLEGFFGIGVEGFKPKSRFDAGGDMVMGLFWGYVLMLPVVVNLYSTDFLTKAAPYVVTFLFLGAIRGLLFYVGGENNFNLAVEGILSAVWIALAVSLINIGWPIQKIYMNINGVWVTRDLTGFFTDYSIPFLPFDYIWTFIMFVTIAIAVWRIIVSSMKITMHVRAGRGIWWQGNWGERRRLRAPFWKRVIGDQKYEQTGTIYHDGYRDSEESQ